MDQVGSVELTLLSGQCDSWTRTDMDDESPPLVHIYSQVTVAGLLW